MIKIANQEIAHVLAPLTWSGSKDTASRILSFSILYNPNYTAIPQYKIKCGDKVEWTEKITNAETGETQDITRFVGNIFSISFSTSENKMNIKCYDFLIHLKKSKAVGRFKGTLYQLADNICSSFDLNNGINIDDTHVHNIVSTGTLSYYDILNIACSSASKLYNLYMNGATLKLCENEPVTTFNIKENIRSSYYSQSIEKLVNKILVIDNQGKVTDQVQNTEDLQAYGLFQEVYKYNKTIKDNHANAQNQLKSTENTATIEVDNNNNCISGRVVKIYEPTNNFEGTFEIVSDEHTIGANSSMTLGVQYLSEQI